jgi:hypothetical protein
MYPIVMLLRIVALVLLVLAAAGISSRVNLTAAGLAIWLLSLMIV